MMEIGREVKPVMYGELNMPSAGATICKTPGQEATADYAKAVTMESAVCIVQSGSGVPIFITVSLCLV